MTDITKQLIGNIKGPKGDQGETGNGIASITEGSTENGVTTYNINFTSGAVTSFQVHHGEKGEQGIQGLTGPKGDSFEIEKTYATIAAMNADASNVEEGKFVMITSADGVEDPDNAKLFVKGTSGFTFITDFSGATGIKGEDGRGITSVAQTNVTGTESNGAVRTNTITFTDNETSTFTVKDGLKGDTGDDGKGIVGIQKTGTDALVDTYTITYTDNDTDTIQVTNGAQGPQGIQGIQGEQGLIPYLSIDSNNDPSGTGNLYVEYITAEEFNRRQSNSS